VAHPHEDRLPMPGRRFLREGVTAGTVVERDGWQVIVLVLILLGLAMSSASLVMVWRRHR
jgi:hypothetical protein